MKRQITQQLDLHCTTDLVKSLYEQIDIIKSGVYFLREELREKNILLKIIVTSKFPEAVDGFIQEKKQLKALIATKEKECCIIDTDGKNDNININNVNRSEEMKINCKINENKNNNYNNLDIEKIISNDIDSKYDSNINDNNIDNKYEKHTISRNGCCQNTNIINIDNNTKEVNINSNDGSENIIINNINNDSKGNSINSSTTNSENKKTKKKKKSAFIIGDSMIKKIGAYLLVSSVNHRYIVKVRSFLSAKTADMFDYTKSTQRDSNPNDLSSDKSLEQISLDILNKSLKLNNNTVVVSNIVPRDDAYKTKADEINAKLEKLCKVNNIEIISHRNVNPKINLNRGRLHFIDSGVSVFVRNFRNFLNNFDEI